MARLMGRKINMIFGENMEHNNNRTFGWGYQSIIVQVNGKHKIEPNKIEKKGTMKRFKHPRRTHTHTHTTAECMKHRGDMVMANIAIAPCARKTTEYNTWILTCTGNIEYHPRKYVYDSNHANCARGIKRERERE